MPTKCPRKKLMKERWTPIEPKISLSESSLFRLVVRVLAYPALFFAALALGSIDFSDHPIASPETLGLLFSRLKQPVILAGLALPLLGLIASHLRSVQAKEQIENQQLQIETQQFQNKFSNYLAHRDQFNSFFKEDEPMEGLSDISKWQIYGRLFPNAQEANFAVNDALVELFTTAPQKLDGISEELIKTRHNNFPDNHKILESLRPIEAEIERFSGFQFEELKDYIHPLTSIHKSLIRQKVLMMKLHDCSNFHWEELAIEERWFCEKSYDETIALVADLTFQEQLYSFFTRIQQLKQSDNDKKKELIDNLRSMMRYHGAIREHTPEELELPQLIRQVLESNFPAEKQVSLLQYLPPEFQVMTASIQMMKQNQEPSSGASDSDESNASS